MKAKKSARLNKGVTVSDEIMDLWEYCKNEKIEIDEFVERCSEIALHGYLDGAMNVMANAEQWVGSILKSHKK